MIRARCRVDASVLAAGFGVPPTDNHRSSVLLRAKRSHRRGEAVVIAPWNSAAPVAGSPWATLSL